MTAMLDAVFDSDTRFCSGPRPLRGTTEHWRQIAFTLHFEQGPANSVALFLTTIDLLAGNNFDEFKATLTSKSAEDLQKYLPIVVKEAPGDCVAVKAFKCNLIGNNREVAGCLIKVPRKQWHDALDALRGCLEAANL